MLELAETYDGKLKEGYDWLQQYESGLRSTFEEIVLQTLCTTRLFLFKYPTSTIIDSIVLKVLDCFFERYA